MNFPTGVIYIWAGTNATIPAGWERVTALDGLYPKGTANATNPNDTGGAATHEHTGTTHTHADTHTHTVTINKCSNVNGKVDTGTGSSSAQMLHTHTGTTGNVSGGGLSEVSCTYAAYSNDPPYHTVIFIKPTAGQTYFPQNGVYLYDGSDTKTGHNLCDGTNSTPNLVDKYLKGAGTGADAGGTGGSVTNIHDLTHTHTVASHTHGSTTSGGPSPTCGSTGSDSNNLTANNHTHTINPSATTATISATAPELTTTETVEPAYKKLLTVQNQNTGSGSYRLGMIGMWLGTLASIPSNYILCDGTKGTQDLRGKHLKSTATTTAIGNTGGSNTHTHASQDHTHTANVHSHTHGDVTHTSVGKDNSSSGANPNKSNETHTVTVANATSVYADATTTGDEQNNEPAYRTVAFIKLNSLINSAGAVFMSMMSLGQPAA